MKSELDYAWDILEEEIPELFADLSRSIEGDLTAFECIVKDYDNTSTFANGIHSRLRDIVYILATTARAFGCGYKAVRRNASEQNYSSYALRGMLPAYRTASQITGQSLSLPSFHSVPSHIISCFTYLISLYNSCLSQERAGPHANNGPSRAASPMATSFPLSR